MPNRRCLNLVLCSCAALSAAACQSYSPKPLSEQAIDQRLAAPTTPELRREIENIHNPLMPPVDVDLEKGLTPASAAAIAVAHNPLVRSQQDAMLTAEADLLQARILPNPQITAGTDVPFGPLSGGNAIAYGLGLDWEITSLITHGTKVRAAETAADQVRLDIAWKQWQAAEAAKMALYDVVALREQLALATRLNDALAKMADGARIALQRHDMTAPDASAVETAAQDAAVSVASTRRDLADATLALNQALGLPPRMKILIAPDVKLPTRIEPPPETALLAGLDKRRIDLVSLRRGYESQEETVRAAILGQFPKISLGISNTRDYGDFLTLGPSLTIDVPIFDRNQGVIATARATRQQLFDEYISRVFDARSAVVRAVTLIRSLNVVIQAQTKEVEMLRAFLTTDEKALKSGNLDAATYFSAAVSLSQKQLDLVKLRQDLLHAQISLEIASGAVLPFHQGATTREGQR